MSFTRAVAANTIVQLIGKAITTGLALALIAALTRYLGVSTFGAYTTVFAYVAFLGVLADFGFFWIMVREIAQIDTSDGLLQKTSEVREPETSEVQAAESAPISKGQQQYERVVNNVLTLRTFLGIAVFALGAAIAWLIPQYGTEVRVGILLISAAWLATALNSTFVGVFQNKLRMDKAVITDIVGRAATLAVTLWLISQGATLTAIFAGYILGTWLNFLLSMVLGWQYVRVRPAFEFSVWRRIFIEAFPMGVVLILHVIYFRIDSVLLSLMKGFTDVGIYGAPYKIFEVLLTIPVMFLGNVFPMLSRLLTDGSPRVPIMVQRSFDALLTIALPLVVGGVLLAEPIIGLVAGPEFVEAATLAPVFGIAATPVLVLQILMVAVGLAFLSNLFNYVMIGLGRQRELVGPYTLFVVVNLALNLLIIPRWSYLGTAASTVLTELVVVGYLGSLALGATKVRLAVNLTWRIALATAVMAGALWLVDANLWWELTLGIGVYSTAAWAFGVITPEFVRELLAGRKK